MSRLAFLLALLVIGCTTAWTYAPEHAYERPPIRVCLEAPDVKHELSDAVALWSHAIEGWRTLVVAQDRCDVVVAEGPCEDQALACADKIGGTRVNLVPGRYEAFREGVLMHELGHILGAQHLDGTLMAPNYQANWSCPDLFTVIQVAAYQHANLTYFRWCQK